MSTTTSKSLNMSSVNRGRLSQRFDLIRKLGQGTYGKVQLGINKVSGVEVALKTIKKSKIENSSDLLRIKREISIMTCCNHPNIIHIYEVYENKEKIILVMEYAQGGELYDYLNEKKKLDEDEAKRIFSQISSAIYYCHKHKIVHRDLKLENILLDENNNAKIADFGLSNVYGDALLKTFCGSPLYASPEIVKGIPYEGPEVDCWSLGVLLYTLIYGSMPFDGTHFKKLVKQITTGSYYEPNFKSGASELIRALLTVDSRRRLTINQVVSHSWLQSTECKSVSEEYCNQAPVKPEYLAGINKSDTLDEVSEMSSESEVTKQKTKPKPPRKVSKATPAPEEAKKDESIPPKVPLNQGREGDQIMSESMSKQEKPHKPPRNDSAKTQKTEPEHVEKEPPKDRESLKAEKLRKEVPKTTDALKPEAQKESPKKTDPPPKKEKAKNDSPKILDGDKKDAEKVTIPVDTSKKAESPKPKSAQVQEKAEVSLQEKEASKVNEGDTKIQISSPKTEPARLKSPVKEAPVDKVKPEEKTPKNVEVEGRVPSNSSKSPCGEETEEAVPGVVLRKRSTSTPLSEETPSSGSAGTPRERRNSKIISQKTADLMQNVKDASRPEKKSVVVPSKLSDIKKKFENGQPPKSPETGIGVILKRRKSVIDSNESFDGTEVPVSPPETSPTANQKKDLSVIGNGSQETRSIKPVIPSSGSKTHNLVIEREEEPVSTTNEIPIPISRPALKLNMPKPTKSLTQPPVSASPPITKQGAVKKIGSLISRVKSNESASSSSSRERIIPIQFEDDIGTPVSRSGTGGTSRSSSRAGSISVSMMSTDGPTPRVDSRSFVSSVGSPASTISSPSYSRHNSFGNDSFGTQHSGGISGCQIMKSKKREFIIPITIEGRDDSESASMTSDSLTRRNSSTATASSSAASSSSRVYSNRRHTSSNLSLLTPDSTDLEDDFFDDDDFLSSDALFSSLLARVRGMRLSDRFKDTHKGRGSGRWTNMELKRK